MTNVPEHFADSKMQKTKRNIPTNCIYLKVQYVRTHQFVKFILQIEGSGSPEKPLTAANCSAC